MPYQPHWIDLALILTGPSLFDKAMIEIQLAHAFGRTQCSKNKIDEMKKRGHSPTPEQMAHMASTCKQRRLHAVTTDWEYYVCPCQLPRHSSLPILIQAARAMQTGILPFAGGIMEQPCVVMDMIQIVQTFLNEYEEEERKKAAKTSAKR